MYQGHGTIQFAPEIEMTPAKMGRGHPRKSGLTGEGLGPFRMEVSVPTRKHGRPRKIPSIDAHRLRSITGVCQCGTLMHAKQEPRSVREYTEEFRETGKLMGVLEPWEFALENLMVGQAMEAERAITVRPRLVQEYTKEFLDMAEKCKSKPAEGWCRCYKASLRRDIRGELNGAMESIEFALVVRMAGKALAAKAWLLNMLFMSQVLNRKRIHRKINNRRIIWNRQLEVSECLVITRGKNTLLYFVEIR
ncbi:hypothetical protein YC2023_038309 [Brassica napus]